MDYTIKACLAHMSMGCRSVDLTAPPAVPIIFRMLNMAITTKLNNFWWGPW